MASHNLIFVLALVFTPLSWANAAITDNTLLEFSLTVEQQDTQFSFAGNTYNTRFDLLGINWYEPFSQHFHAGVELGNFDMTQTANSLLSAQFTQGQYAGLLLRFIPFENDYLEMFFNINYRYSQSEGTDASQTSQFAWHERQASAEVFFLLSDITRLFIAADYHQLSGEQRDSGTINKITSFSEKTIPGYRFGIDFRSNRHNIVRLNWLAGYREGGSITFLHKF